MIKLYGFGVLKNGIKFDFPFRESVLSMEPITENVFYALGDSEDQTNEEFKKFSFCKTIHTLWDKTLTDGHVISDETNKALKFLKSEISLENSWGLYLQSDEVLHEDDYQLLKNDLEVAASEGFDAISFCYLHFWQTHHHLVIGKTWYPHEIRAIKLNTNIESWGDGQSFKNCQKIYYSNARIFHYGHVREQSAYKEKIKFQTSFHHLEDKVQSKLEKGEKKSKKHKGVLFFGTHPKIMKNRILRMNDIWELPKKNIVYIVGNPEKYSPDLISKISAHSIIWCKSTREVPKTYKKAMVIADPSFIDRLLKKSEIPKSMFSPLARPWTDDFRLIMQLSEKNIGLKGTHE